MSVETTNNLNYLLSLVLTDEMEQKFYDDVVDYVGSLPPMDYNWASANLRSKYLVASILNKYKESVSYIIADNSLDKAKSIMEYTSPRETVDKIFELRKKYCMQVPEIERIMLGWYEI